MAFYILYQTKLPKAFKTHKLIVMLADIRFNHYQQLARPQSMLTVGMRGTNATNGASQTTKIEPASKITPVTSEATKSTTEQTNTKTNQNCSSPSFKGQLIDILV